MRMLSGRMHWLTVGLALLVSAHGFATKNLHGQAPLKPAGVAAKKQAETLAQPMPAHYAMPMGGAPMGVMPTSGMMPGGMPGGMMPGGMPGGMMPGGMPGPMGPQGPMSISFEGPPPMDMAQGGVQQACHSSCNAAGGCQNCGGCNSCGGHLCHGRGCGPLSRLRGGCMTCGGLGCAACRNGCLLGGRLVGLLGCLAPYSEGGVGAQRWFDLYAGTIGLQRTSDFGGFGTPDRDLVTGEFARSNVLSTLGISGTPLLRSDDVDLERMQYGLELIANLQTGPGANLEARYFGLNNWETEQTVRSNNPDIYSVYSLFGTQPAGGFDDTDRSFVQGITYNSEIHNGEVNYRRRFVSPAAWAQGSWLMGVRYFDLDERFSFNAIGSRNNTFTFDQLRFFNQDTHTRNQLTGFQVGGDFWVNLVPGIHLGVESKGGIFGNHSEVETQIFSNSIPGAREFMQDGTTAYLGELTASVVYRLTYAWSLRTSYNVLYVDNVALAPENFNTRDLSNALGSGAFTMNRFPFIDTDGEVTYQGWSIGGEYLF